MIQIQNEDLLPRTCFQGVLLKLEIVAIVSFSLVFSQLVEAQNPGLPQNREATSLSTTSLKLSDLFEADSEPDHTIDWLKDGDGADGEELFVSGSRRVLVVDDPKKNSTFVSIPFIGDFDISARIGIEELPSGFYGAGFTVAWAESQRRDSAVVLTNQSLRTFSRSSEDKQEILHTVGKKGMGENPWVRLRRLGNFVSVYISEDGAKWVERSRYSAQGERGRIGLTVYGNPELGVRLASFDHLHLATRTIDQKSVRIGSLVEAEDTDGNDVPDSFDRLLARADEDSRSPEDDADKDGVENWQEYILETSPTNAKETPLLLPKNDEKLAGMLVEQWSYPANMYSLGTLPIEIPEFPLGASAQYIVPSLDQIKIPKNPTVIRLRTMFQTGEGGFHEFELRGVRTGRMTLTEIDPEGRHRFPVENVFAISSNQRLGSGSVHLKRERWYQLDLLALHRNQDTRPELWFAEPGAVEMKPYVSESCRLPSFDPEDTDRDGLPDLWEEIALGNTFSLPFEDADRDGLLNLVEYIKGTDPLSRDTDADGVEDRIEDGVSSEVALDPQSLPLPGVPKHWEFGWIPPEQNPVGSDEPRPLPEQQSIFSRADGTEWTLIADIATFRGNRVGWVPWLYQQIEGDFDLTTRVDFPGIPDELALLRSVGGGLAVRRSMDGSDSFEFALAAGNLGETMVMLAPAPGTDQKALYEFGFGGIPSPDIWLRMIRRGDELIAAWSPDREVWMQAGPTVRVPDGPLLVGTIALGNTALTGELGVRFRSTAFSDPDDFARPQLLRSGKESGGRTHRQQELSFEETSSMGFDTEDAEKWKIFSFPNQSIRVPATLENTVAGTWATAGARGVYVKQGTGALEFSFSLDSPKLHRAVIEAGPALNYGGSIEALFDLSIDLDGELLEQISVIPQENGMSEFAVALPFLPEGRHTLSVTAFSPRPGFALPLNRIRIEPLEVSAAAPSSKRTNDTAPGILERLRNRFRREAKSTEEPQGSQMQDKLIRARNLLPSGIYTSPVSPAFVEGKARFPESVHVVSSDETSDQERQQAIAGPDNDWYFNLPLEAGKATSIRFEAEGGAAQSEAKWEWTPINVLDGGKITIRRGDSLLLAPQPEGGTASKLYRLMEGDEEIASLQAGETFAREFKKNGAFPIQVFDDGSGKTPLATLLVDVPRAEFPEDPVVIVGRERKWNLPRMEVEGSLDSDKALSLAPDEAPPSDSYRTYSLASDQPGRWKVAMRLPSGVVSDVASVDSVRLYHATETSIDQVSLGDEGRMMSLQWAVPDTSANLRFQVRIMAATGVFTDGSIMRILTMGNRDAKGRLGVQALQPPGESRALCHQVFVFDGDTFIGSL